MVTDDIPTSPTVQPRAVLTTLHVLGIMFLACIGGAYGFEDAVRGGGGAMAPLFFIVLMPIVWGIPLALCLAELSCAIPSPAGSVLWIGFAFPKGITYVVAVASIFNSFAGNALYPNMFVDYVFHLLGLEGTAAAQDSTLELLLKLGVVVFSVIINIVGVELVGTFSVGLCVTVLSPFILLVLLGANKMSPSAWVEPPEHIHWQLIITLMTWNFAGLDFAGNLVEEMQCPQSSILHALSGVMFLATLTYGLPVLVGTSVAQDWSQWQDGYWVDVSRMVVGDWLAWWLLACACLSTVGTLVTQMCTNSRELQGTALMGCYPDAVGVPVGQLHPRYSTPHIAIIVNGVITFVLSHVLTFVDLIYIDMLLYTVRTSLELITLVTLRITQPSLKRPFTVPGGTWGCILIATPPFLWCMLNISLNMYPLLVWSVASYHHLLTVLLSFACLPVLWWYSPRLSFFRKPISEMLSLHERSPPVRRNSRSAAVPDL
eukprot:TRINITY_DN12962_c0_g1_i3.p1 TRINITY_DN12962_c0_g1~~TRINITY_DN12962_c0_g1_i3.p1  ORF type:complete len:487 (-),score=63.62 TRINITY_DN12962_c0_g1_i3:92-1552(-)